MYSETYKTKTGKTQFRPVLESEDELLGDGRDSGFCLHCGNEAYGVEPDARQYTCESCGEKKVYGLEELLIMGLLKFEED